VTKVYLSAFLLGAWSFLYFSKETLI